jgi:hypothetical protein
MRTLIASSALAAAALLATTPGALAQSGQKAFCLQSGGAKSCIYDTMAACEQAKGARQGASCVANPESTGRGGPPAPK